jgi:hypothetical protein
MIDADIIGRDGSVETGLLWLLDFLVSLFFLYCIGLLLRVVAGSFCRRCILERLLYNCPSRPFSILAINR